MSSSALLPRSNRCLRPGARRIIAPGGALCRGAGRTGNPTRVERMAWRLRTPAGKKLCALCKQTPEPVFGIIKAAMGFRQFLLRGLDRVRGEWSLVTMAWNVKRI
jgi:Transposase DDE domain